MENKNYAVNPLTLIPGGVTLELRYSDGKKSTQNNVKYPKKYVERVLSEQGANLVSAFDVTRGVTVYKREESSSQLDLLF
jgi:hypothetical protein